MSGVEQDLRRLEPVDPVTVPDRFSQTLVVKSDACPRSAYLYMKYSGGAPSPEMIRGTALHMVLERATNMALEQDEGEVPPELVRDLVAEVLREVPVPSHEVDYVRMMAHRWAERTTLDPARIVAVERKILLPVGEHVVSMKLDLATLSEDGSEGEVVDYKSSRRLPAEDDVSVKMPDGRRIPTTPQLLVYALGLKYGFPVRKVPCEPCAGTGKVPCSVEEDHGGCPFCGGTQFQTGKGYVEERDPFPLAGGAQVVHVSEVYPGPDFDDELASRGASIVAAEMPDHMAWLEGVVERLVASTETWKFEAIDGSHCSECPARHECPLPEEAKEYRGVINTQEELSRAVSAYFRRKDELAADWKEIKGMVDVLGPTRFGKDQVLEFATQERNSTDMEALQAGVEEAIEWGRPFDVRDYVKTSKSTPLKKRKLRKDELEEAEAEPPVEREADLDEKYGAEAPF